MAFVKHKLPCNKCGGSDPVSLDDKGAGFCFSCNTYFKNYSTSEVPQNTDTIRDFKTYQRNSSMETQGFEAFHPLTDRKISLETAKKYGVKSTLNPDGSVDKHYYPFFVGTELVATKIRKANKEFAWTGNSKEAGLFG